MADIDGTNFDDALDGTVGDDTISGLDGNDILNGLEGDDKLLGGRGNDVLDGGADNDTLDGGDDDDRLIGGTGEDTLSGGAGSDRLEDNDGANNTLLGGDGTDTLLGTGTLDGGADNDAITLYGSSTVTGTADGGDGNDSLNYVAGGTNDILRGGAGNDTLTAGTFATVTLDGGDGDDNIYSHSRYRDNQTMIGGDGNDTIRSYWGNDVLQGDAGNDYLDGGQDNDTLSGGTGDDTLIGGSGDDSLDGGDGDDLLNSGPGSDTIDGGADNSASGTLGDIAVFWGDRNTYVITRDASDPSALRVVTILSGEENLVRNIQTLRFSDADYAVATLDIGQYQVGTDSNETLTGTAFDDVINGGLGSDTIDGGDGRNRLLGGEGDDSLTSGANDDYLSGGSGIDTLSGGAGSDRLEDNDGANNTLLGGDGTDTLLGTGTLDGGADNDAITLYGSSTVTGTADGGDGNDNLNYVAGGTNDILRGGAGNDTLSAGAFATVTLDGGDGDDNIYSNSRYRDNQTMIGGDGNDTIRSYWGNDVLQGDAGNDYLDGGQDNDTLSGGTGDDTLIGGSGDDSLDGGDGDDLLNSGPGSDTIDGGADNSASGTLGDIAIISGKVTQYAIVRDTVDSDAIQVKQLSGSEVDVLKNVETLRFNDGDVDVSTLNVGEIFEGTASDDSLAGTTGDDLLIGGVGDDTLTAGAGSDTLIGGEGDDLLEGQNNDVAYFSGPSTQFTWTEIVSGAHAGGWQVTDTTTSGTLGVDIVIGISTLRFTDIDVRIGPVPGLVIDGTNFDDALDGTVGDDTISGIDGNDILNGLEGDDILLGGSGNDVLDGGADDDTLDGGDDDDRLIGGTGEDTLSGGAGSDRLEDNDGANNTLLGGDGEDTLLGTGSLDGGADNDTITLYGSSTFTSIADGGDGNDSLSYGGGGTNDILRGGAGNDTLYVSSQATVTLDGGGGDDLIYSNSGYRRSGNDTMIGGDGNDTIRSYQGNDQLFGGSGNDFLDASHWDTRFADDDTIDGGAGDDTLIGGLGDDSLDGGDGDDLLNSGSGNDTIDGGADNSASGTLGDIAVFSGDRNSYVIARDASNLSTLRVVSTLGGEENLVRNVETLRFSDAEYAVAILDIGDYQIGTDNNDALTGTAFDDVIAGGLGNDTIEGGDGRNRLLGGEGDDILTSGANDDYLSGGTGVDTLSGGGGSDRLEDNDGANNTLLGGDGEDTLLGTGSLDGGADNDTITLYGSSTFTSIADGGDGNDSLSYGGGGTNDILRGGTGNDTLNVSFQASVTLDGGDGDDLIYSNSGYNRSGNDTMIGGDGNDTIRSHQGNDQLFGGSGNDFLDASHWDTRFADDDTIDGGAGDDTLIGGLGDDSLDGGDGDDLLNSGSGNDTIDGGADNKSSDTLGDIAVFSGTRSDYSVVGDEVGLTIFDNRLNSPDGIDRVTNVEIIRFSDGDADVATEFVGLVINGTPGDDNGEPGNPDALTGSILNDQIFGLAGNDLLIGLQGLDRLDGGDGNDILRGDEGADTLLGGTGDDLLYGGSQDDDLSGGEGNDSLFGQLGNDVLLGDDGDDILSGSSGNDTLDGGNDLLGTGGIGDVAVFDGARADYAVTADALDASLFRVSALDGSEEDVVRNIEIFRFSDGDYPVSSLGMGLYIVGSDVDDVIVGTENGDVIRARFGNDVVDAGNGNNRVEAGDGNDTVTSGTGDDVILGGDGNDAISSGAGADRIIDTDGANTIDAGEGDDTVDASGSISGGGGNDAITYRWVAGATDDLVSGGEGNDTITVASSSGPLANLIFEGNAGNDLIQATNTSSGSERMFGGTGDDTLLSGGGDDFLSGDEGADYLDGRNGNDTLLGGSGNDQLLGGSGDDNLSGGDGDDEFVGGGGNDRIDGGSDNSSAGSAGDTARFSGQRDQYSVVLGSEGIDVFDNRLTAPDGVDRLTGIENIVFSDLTMTFDSSISGLVVTGTQGDDNGLPGNPSKLIGTQLDDRILGLNGNDVLVGDAGADILIGGFGADVFEASLSDLNGDVIEDFSAPDKLRVTDELFSAANLQITPGAGNTDIGIDTDLDGAAESTFTLQGSFSVGDLVFAPAPAGGTLISLVNLGAPTATAKSIPTVKPETSIPLRSLFSWDDPDGEADIIEFSVVDQSIEGGYLTRDGDPVIQDEGTTIPKIPFSQIDRWAFVSGADGEFDNIGFVVTDSVENTSDVAVAYVESSSKPEQPIFDFSGDNWEDILLMSHFALDAYNGTGQGSKGALVKGAYHTVNGNDWQPILSTFDGVSKIPLYQNQAGPQYKPVDFYNTYGSGMQATAYQETGSSRIVVSFRGTDEGIIELLTTSIALGLGFKESGEEQGIIDVINVLELAHKIVTRSYILEAFSFVNHLIEDEEKNVQISDITFTGHSLGAMVAGYLAAATGQQAMIFDTGPNTLINRVLEPRDLDEFTFAQLPGDGDYENVTSLRLTGEVLGELAGIGHENALDNLVNFIYELLAQIKGEIASNFLGISEESVDALVARAYLMNVMGNELPDARAGGLFNDAGLFVYPPQYPAGGNPAINNDSVDLHDMKLLSLISYADNILLKDTGYGDVKNYKVLPGFLRGFLNEELGQSAIDAYFGSVPVIDVLSHIILSRFDYSGVDVLSPLLRDVEFKLGKLLKVDFAGETDSVVLGMLSSLAIEHAARVSLFPLKSVDYNEDEFITEKLVDDMQWVVVNLGKSIIQGENWYGLNQIYSVLEDDGDYENFFLSISNDPDLQKIQTIFENIDLISVAEGAASWDGESHENMLIIGGDEEVSINHKYDGNDILFGTDGADKLNAWFGNNVLLGGDGDDTYKVHVKEGNTTYIADTGGDADNLVIDGHITGVKSEDHKTTFEINDGDGIVVLYNGTIGFLVQKGRIENIYHDEGKWNLSPFEKIENTYIHDLSGANSVVAGVSGSVNTINAKLDQFNNTSIYNWGSGNGNSVIVQNTLLNYDNFTTEIGSLIVSIDTNFDGINDVGFTFKGNYYGKDIHLSYTDSDTVISITDQTTPVAVDDAYSTDESTVISGNFLTDTINGLADSDQDGDALIVSLINGEVLDGLDTDHSKPGTQVLLASGAILDIAASGAFTYDPNSAFEHLGVGQSALDILTYEVSDQRRDGVDTAEVTFTVEGLNDKPAAADDSFTGDKNTVLTGNLLTDNGNGVDSDVDGDVLTLQSAVTSSAQGGSVVINTDGSFYYTPFENFSGVDSFDYTLLDGNGDSDTATVTVTINGIDEEPTLTPITGTTGRDILTGTSDDDIIHSLGGSIDRMSGKAGADIFVFGEETLNGVRERDIILDYEVGIDSILLEDGASIGSIRPTSSGVAVFFEGDRDAAYIQGEGVLVGNLTFVPEDILLG